MSVYTLSFVELSTGDLSGTSISFAWNKITGCSRVYVYTLPLVETSTGDAELGLGLYRHYH